MRRFIAVAALLFLARSALAQETRFELGQRLRAFEFEWDRVTEAAARKRALPHLKQATTSFFSAFLTGQSEEAGRALDLARLTLQAKEPLKETLWAESFAVVLDHRLSPGSSIEVTLQRFYRAREKQPDGLRFRVILMHDGKTLTDPLVEDVKQLPVRIKLPLGDVKEGDHTLRGEVLLRDRVLSRSEQTLSVVPNLAARLEQMSKVLNALEQSKTTDYFSAKMLVSLVGQLAVGRTLETNYPAARLLSETELLLKSLANGKTHFDRSCTGQHWLSVAVKERSVPVRIQIPAAAKEGKPLPLVIALHGVGGSENMFFDGYGHGAIARLCAERNWLLVGTRDGLAEGLVEELAKLFPIDSKNVFLVGHSMGAAQVVAAASRNPDRYAGVAALGGGGSMQPSEAIRKVAFFVGIGKEDFVALRGAQALKSNLERLKIEQLIYKVYENVEHIVIVQQCLPEVFKLFDEAMKRR